MLEDVVRRMFLVDCPLRERACTQYILYRYVYNAVKMGNRE